MIRDTGAVDAETIQAALTRFDKAVALENAGQPPVIAVVGAFSRGKSALINALIELPFLPVHPLPTTCLPTRLVHAETPIAALVYPDREQALALDDLAGKQSHVELFRTSGAIGIRIGCPSPLLSKGITLLDTVGIDALNAASRIVDEDVAVLMAVFAADPPLGAEELAFFAELSAQVPDVIWVQTKVDLLSDVDLQTVTQFNQSALNERCARFSEMNAAIYSVSVKTGAGLAALKRGLMCYDADNLRHMRRNRHLKIARDIARPVLNRFSDEKNRLDALRQQLTAAETMLDHDLEEIRAGMISTLSRLSEYVLGNLYATIYGADPSTLSGPRGIIIADDELRRVRDQLVNEVERALILARRIVIESLAMVVLPADAMPDVPNLVLPDPLHQTITIRIVERRRLLPSQIDAGQTIRAYRTAVAHMSDQYAAVLSTPLEKAFDRWQAQTAAWFTDQRTNLFGEYQKAAERVDKLRAWF